MIGFHVTHDGPSECNASIRECPYADDCLIPTHFQSWDEANRAYHDLMSLVHGATGTTRSAPDRGIQDLSPSESALTRSNAEVLLNRAGSHESVGRIVAYGLTGSMLYNLNTPSSDRDITIITDAKSRRDYHKVFDDGEDVRVVSINSFASRILDSQPTDVDFLMSETLSFDDSPYEAYLRSLRFDTNAYLARCEAHTIEHIKSAFKDERDSRRRKSLKTSFRNAVMFNRVSRYGVRYTSRFSSRERHRFYDRLGAVYTDFEVYGRRERPFEVFSRLLRYADYVDS